MAIREITMRLPEELLQSFDEVIERQSLTRDEALIGLVEDYVQRRAVEREIAEATLARLKTEEIRMSTATLTTIVEPLVKRKLFATTEEAVLELMQDYTLRQISSYQHQIAELERRYGMNFAKFTQYLHERGAILQSEELSPEQRRSLGRALMAEEDDWLDWKVATEMLRKQRPS